MGREPEVDVGAVAQVVPLLDEVLRLADRMAVRVLDERRHPPDRRRVRPGREVLALGRSRIHQVDVGVHEPGQQEQAGRVDGRAALGRRVGVNDAPVVDMDVTPGPATG